MEDKKPKYYLDNIKEIGKGYVIVEHKCLLPKGKTTTEGEYPKLTSDDNCAFPERACCNDGEFFSRCEYMKYDNSESPFSSVRWKCRFKDFKSKP